LKVGKKLLEPLSKTRISQSAVEVIKEYIAAKNLQPGAKLPSERELCQALNISRASVREALRTLEIIGLIEVKPGSGIYFRDWTGDLAIPLSAWLPNEEETLQEIFEVRLLIEPRAAGLAAERATPEIIKKMGSCLANFNELVEQNDLPGIIIADTEFHRLIALATENKTLTFVMNTMTRFLREGWKATLKVPNRPIKTISEHEKIFESIKNHDSIAAIQSMHEHLATALEEMRNINGHASSSS
jgi:GntR family transcriptional regulator, transcriptional repressor for pyruvate dehydrogenase complex